MPFTRRRSDAFQYISAYDFGVANLTGDSLPQQVSTMHVSADFLTLLLLTICVGAETSQSESDTSDPTDDQPLVRVGTVLPADPHMMEMDMDYNFWHDSNPEAYYSGEYGRDKYTRVWRQQGFACDLQFTPSCTDDGSFFVKQVYRDVLNREADPGGLAFYQGQIDQCNYDSARRQLEASDWNLRAILEKL